MTLCLRCDVNPQARSHSVEAELFNTTAELRESKEHQQQLANRNALLEKLAVMNSKQSDNKTVAAVCCNFLSSESLPTCCALCYICA